jgi:uncharacterized protein YndB with AHSA1/START domain
MSSNSKVAVTVSRFFYAPSELIFDAWLDAKGAGRWLFATPGGEMKRVEIEARVGGGFVVAERRGDTVVEHVGTYIEIVRPRRLVFDFAVPQFSAEVARATIEIAARRSGCELALTQAGVPPEYQDRAAEGWTACLAALAAALPAKCEFVIAREFDAPRERVFQAWTDAQQVARWWGPRGFTNPVCDWDARPGQPIRVVMRAPNGTDFPMGGEFRECAPPERLVFTSGALDEAGNMLFEFHHTVLFAERSGKTAVTIISSVMKATAEANKYIGGFEAGMAQSLERLATSLATPSPPN